MLKEIRIYFVIKVNGHNGCVNQVDNGLKMVKNLIKMMDVRTKIEEKYAAELEKFSQTQRKLFANMYENEHTKHVVMELITEADCTAHIHRQSRKVWFWDWSENQIFTILNICQK